MNAPPQPDPQARTIRCPACGGPSIYAANNIYRPFCSARCKGVDLGAWASESYRVDARPEPDDEDAAPPPPETDTNH
jgi:uncharacterized protein